MRIIHMIQSVAALSGEGPNLEALDAAWYREGRAILNYAMGDARGSPWKALWSRTCAGESVPRSSPTHGNGGRPDRAGDA